MKDVSDLKGKSQDLTLYGSPECRQRIDCLLGLEKYYGLQFKSFTPVDIALRYEVLDKGQADLSILFTTDAQLAAQKNKYVILNDDKHVFPAGNVIFVTDPATVSKAGPDYEKTIDSGPEGPDDPGDAGARRPGRHRQADPGAGRLGVPEGGGLHQVMRHRAPGGQGVGPPARGRLRRRQPPQDIPSAGAVNTAPAQI